MNRRFILVGLVFFAILFVALIPKFVIAAFPSGASITPVSNDTAGLGTPGDHAAIAGNMSELTLTGYSASQAWSGYYGNVSGTIHLADTNSKVMYNWTQASAVGEVYSSLNSSIDWATIMCFNISTDHSDQISDLEGFFNIDSGDTDGVDETFTSNDHAEFQTDGVSFEANQCNNTKLFGSGGAATYDEILLIDGSNRTVYASILSDDTTGFDDVTHDFEMMVPEDGHSGNTQPTTYYFYVELEG